MEKQSVKTRKVIIITLISVVFVLAIIAGLFMFKKSDENENKIVPVDEQTPEQVTEVDDTYNKIEEVKEEIVIKDNSEEELYSVIFLDSDGKTLQSTYFKKGPTPYYSGESLSGPGQKFKAWVPTPSVVNGNQAYIATYYYLDSSSSSSNNMSSTGASTPSSSNTYASIIYNDIEGNQQSLILDSGTTINFSAGEHGTYDSIPTSVTLTDNQQLDITDLTYNPSQVEVNYIFKGFSYSGNTMKCEYSLANNIVNVECKQIENTIVYNNVLYIKQDYIESTGSQWINTGLFPATNRKVEIDCVMTQAGDEAPVFFGAVNSSTGRFDVYAHQSKAWYRTNNSGAATTLDYTAGDRVTIGMYTTGTVKHYF